MSKFVHIVKIIGISDLTKLIYKKFHLSIIFIVVAHNILTFGCFFYIAFVHQSI